MQSYKEDVCVHAKTVKKEEKEGMETAQGAEAESETLFRAACLHR